MSIKYKYSVRSIETYLTKDWLLHKHYAKRMCSISYAFGLFKDNIMEGVCTFGMPPSSTLAESIAGNDYKKYVLELNRLIVNEGLEKNTLSFFVSNAINNLPKPTIIISFSDQNMGHSGYIYQSTNFIYTGQSSNTSKLIDKNGDEFHFINIGHYQQNNKLKVSLVKRRLNEENIDRIQIANYLKKYKGNYTIKQLDKIFGYKDTCGHWFRTDAGFSFPNVDDWLKLKELFNFDNTFDELMTKYEMIPDANEIIKKLQLKKVDILPKHRYLFIHSNKVFKKKLLRNLKLKIEPYPKGDNKRYDASFKPTTQIELF